MLPRLSSAATRLPSPSTRTLSRTVSGNLFFSPSSIMAVLAMAFAGADGDTAREMADVLGFVMPRDRLHEAFRKLRDSTRPGGVELRVANRLWGQRGYRFLPGVPGDDRPLLWSDAGGS